jgi:signal transduction histidine kinase
VALWDIQGALSERSSAWLEHLVWDQDVAGSNPVAPTTFFLGCCPDITKQKEFEAELQRVVDERTAKLHELVNELEHFSYTITHDLKAPLRAMRGFAEMMSL